MVIGSQTKLGYDSAIIISEEATFGTVNSTPAQSIKYTNETLKHNIDEVLLSTINTSRNYIDRFQGNVSVEGSVEFPLHHTDGILFLKHAIGGTVTTSTISAGACYVHTFNPTGGSLNFGTETSLTIRTRRGNDFYIAYSGLRVQSYTLTGNIGEPINCMVDLVGANSALQTTIGAISFSTDLPFTFKGAKFYENTSSASTITSGEQYITNFEFTVNNNIVNDESVRALGTNTVVDLPPNALRDVTLNITQRFDTTTAYNQYLTNTARSVILLIDSGVTITGASATTYSMRIELPKCYYNEDASNVGGPGVLTQTIPLRCVADSIGGYDVQVKLANGVSSY